MTPKTTPIICIAGPTASGKSASVLTLAEHLPIEIINVDSATIYRSMNIGTAKPSKEEQALVPQHLLDIKDPSESYSAADFYQDTIRLISEIQSRQHIPILAGGTMMYYKTLREGLHDLPAANEILRAELETEAAKIGWPAMHEKLRTLDAITADRLAPNDSQRIQRALEVIILTGKPLSSLFAEQKTSNSPYRFITISLETEDRAKLHARIAERFMQMMAKGFLEEVHSLYQRGDLHENLPSIRCVGYRQLWKHIAGEIDLETAIEQGIAATRQLAKRQITWLRSQPERLKIDCFSKDVPSQVLDIVKKYKNQMG
ncbi:tRNA (adenosine(37)-N6)-dimethylallyltransferase MiaA [Pelistega europaea]|uniref:tRNA dimethylallyltransferase n=1 Tax=Pelistega europaea TaxID=106147 RepID=A0A7Y4P585_9BURK|nr:tRNA (adenosine(37)-N6)-dimethylallyltransferase MiaA [Pelistega europaea]NOL49528.1 tRNA (adenosine(37)-N6)-dimethylallyltransferase MiaA [Pelistega europaea]